MKAIGIIGVVVGHSGCPQSLHDFIYLFHMPLFFVIAGYFFKEKYCDDILGFVKKKMVRLYIPFVLCNFLVLLLHNCLFSIGISNQEYDFHEFLGRTLKVLLLSSQEPMVGALWFLRSMLISFIALIAIFKITEKLKKRDMIRLCITLLMLFVGFFFSSYLKTNNINRELMIPSLLMLGYIISKHKETLLPKLSAIWTILLVVIMVVISPFYTFDVIAAIIIDPVFLILVSYLGFVMVYNVAALIRDWKWLTYIGDNSMTILITHGIVLKTVQLCLLYWADIVINNLCGSLINNQLWWLFSILGILVPIIFSLLCDRISKTIR